ncbi:uncharacterized protein M6B38_399290 [Iris pallida]|uniref:Rubisco LSMT substrate-binding domain-containing protein n=1 Tax=Iris pallida TaxID=29817 RepID=A0AAX6FVT7_IRIPA|nr:uncharacterized protein M6B38_399290 [Iris pallida]
MRAWAQISHIYLHRPSLLRPCIRRMISSSAPAPKDGGHMCKCDEFLPWLQQKTGHEISSMLSVGFSTCGRSLLASQPIQPGDCLMKVPYSAQITTDKIHPELEPLLADNVGDISRVAVVLLAEKKLGQLSEWAPYINCLPHINEMHNTIFWSTEELDMLQQSPIYQETTSQKTFVKEEFSAVKSVIADQSYAAGDQVLIRYGRFSNATLLLDFGFTLPCNIYDQVQIWMDLPAHDPLYTMKLELLHKHCLPKNSPAKALHTSGSPFIIKEVKSATGKGKGIPQALRAFARVLSITSHEELKALGSEAAVNDGRLARHPLKNKESEIQAHGILISRLNNMIQGHDSAIKVLESMDPDIDARHALRRQMARDLLTGELRVLKSACAWLTCYCSRLSSLSIV